MTDPFGYWFVLNANIQSGPFWNRCIILEPRNLLELMSCDCPSKKHLCLVRLSKSWIDGVERQMWAVYALGTRFRRGRYKSCGSRRDIGDIGLAKADKLQVRAAARLTLR